MPRIKKADAPVQVLRIDDVHVASLGGDVGIRQLSLPDFLKAEAELVGQSPADQVPIYLSWVIVDADGERLYSPDEWMAWGGSHVAEAVDLYKQAMEMKVRDIDDAKKNSAPSPA